MEEDISRMVPVGEVQQDVVPSRKEKCQRGQSHSDDACPSGDFGEDLLGSGGIPGVGLNRVVVETGEQDVEDNQDDNVGGLTEGWEVEPSEDRCLESVAEQSRIRDVRSEFDDEHREEECEEGSEDGYSDSNDQKRHAER